MQKNKEAKVTIDDLAIMINKGFKEAKINLQDVETRLRQEIQDVRIELRQEIQDVRKRVEIIDKKLSAMELDREARATEIKYIKDSLNDRITKNEFLNIVKRVEKLEASLA